MTLDNSMPLAFFILPENIRNVFSGCSGMKFLKQNESRTAKFQKQPFRGALRKMCSEIMQQIYRRAPMTKCNFNKLVTSSTWVPDKKIPLMALKTVQFDSLDYNRNFRAVKIIKIISILHIQCTKNEVFH